MTDEEFAQTQERIRALTDRWREPFGLDWYDLDFSYVRSGYKPPENESAPNRGTVMADCKADWRYGSACITWNMPEIFGLSDEELERVFVHECMHIFLNEMRWTATNDADSLDHEERVASTLTKAFLWQRDHLTKEGA